MSITAISLASKLVVSIIQIHDFWTSIQDAPEDFQSIARDLRLLQTILEEIERIDESTMIRLALEEFHERVEKLLAIIHQFEPGFASSKGYVRKWSALKSMFRKDQVRKIQESLSHTKQSLLLAGQISQMRQTQLQPQAIVDKITAFVLQQSSTNERLNIVQVSTDNSSSLESQLSEARHAFTNDYCSHSSRSQDTNKNIHRALGWKTSCHWTTTRWRTVFGTLNFQRESSALVSDQGDVIEKRDYQNFILRPSAWMIELGWRRAFQASLSGISLMIETPRIVPRSSPLFEYCQKGEIRKIQELISNKKASLLDVDEYGNTALHYAARTYQADTCIFLITAGARTTQSSSNFTPLTYSLYGSNYDLSFVANSKLDIKNQVVTQRALMSRDQDYQDEMLTFLTSSFGMARIWPTSNDGLVFRALLHSSKVLQGELLNDVVADSDFNKMWQQTVVQRIWTGWQSWNTPGVPDCSIDTYDKVLDLALVNLGHPSVFHGSVLAGVRDIKHMLDNGANPHLITNGSRNFSRSLAAQIYKQKFDTPTSLAMYSSKDFISWREALARVDVKLEEFIDCELSSEQDINGREMPLLRCGWTKDNLKRLFSYPIRPSACEKKCACMEASKWYMEERLLLKQPQWLRFIWYIKHLGVVPVNWNEAENLGEKVDVEKQDFDKADSQTSPQISSTFQLALDDTMSEFCFPGHRGCYVCEYCWYANETRNFWLVRDTSPEEHLADTKMPWECDEENSPFLFSIT